MLIVSNKAKLKKIGRLLALLLIIFSIVAYFSKIVIPLVTDMANAEVKSLVTNKVNDASAIIREFSHIYDEFYTYEKNNDGEIVLAKANTSAINQLSIYAQKVMQDKLNSLNEEQISLPIGAFSGSAWLSNKGEPIKFNVVPIGSSVYHLNSYYYTEGINQTLHRLILRIKTTVKVIIPMNASDVEVITDIVISENIIVGRVPDSYITGISDDNIFDLMP